MNMTIRNRERLGGTGVKAEVLVGDTLACIARWDGDAYSDISLQPVDMGALDQMGDAEELKALLAAA